MTKSKNIPTKADLLQLQKLYKTDEKIGERLGGVPAYLVAYWRRKKNIPKYSLPKFSDVEVRTLWERYGDDEKCGLELGISKAAYYNWRRRYGIREKPAFLKLEQLELDFPGSRPPAHSSSLYGQRSMAQKIIAVAADLDRVEVGQTVELEPNLAISAGSPGNVLKHFKGKMTEHVWNPSRLVITLGADTSSSDSEPNGHDKKVRDFVRRQGIKSFFDLPEGTCHQLAVERGLVLPGHLVLGTAHGLASCGSLSALALPIDPVAMGETWKKGRCSVEVPAAVRITVGGRRPRSVSAIDIALSTLKQMGSQAALKRVIEFGGTVVSQMSIGERIALCTVSSEHGAITSLCNYDATARRYLTGRTITRFQPILPDKDAEYAAQYQINVDHLEPQIALGGDPKKVKRVVEVENSPIHLVILGSCTAGRFEDMRVAADILKGKQVHEDCRMMIIPGSRTVYLEALKKGLVRVFVEAGAVVMNPGCREAMLTGRGWLASSERCLVTSALHLDALPSADQGQVYLCSPATAAASALNGAITDPTRFVK